MGRARGSGQDRAKPGASQASPYPATGVSSLGHYVAPAGIYVLFPM